MAGETILVVEDDADLGMLVLHQLNKAGYKAALATDGVQAMQPLDLNVLRPLVAKALSR